MNTVPFYAPVHDGDLVVASESQRLFEFSVRGPARRSRTETSFVGARLGPYQILSSIGAGGMGEVYLARDVGSTQVAIKLGPPRLQLMRIASGASTRSEVRLGPQSSQYHYDLRNRRGEWRTLHCR